MKGNELACGETLCFDRFSTFILGFTFSLERNKPGRVKERVRGRKVMSVNAAMRLIVCGVHRRAVINF